MTNLSSKELFLACLSNPSVVRSRLEKKVDVVNPDEVIVEASASKDHSSRSAVRTNSGQSDSHTESLHSSTLSFGDDEASRMFPLSPYPNKDSTQDQESVAESSNCPDRLQSPSKSFHRILSIANVKPLPPRTLGQIRWNSSRSINKDCPPQAPLEEQPVVSRSPHVLNSSRSPRKPRQGAGSSRPSPTKSVRSAAPVSSYQSILENLTILVEPDADFDNVSYSSVSSSDASTIEKPSKRRPQSGPPATIASRPTLAKDRWSSNRCIRYSTYGDDVDDEDDVSVEVEAAPRSPRRSLLRMSSQARFTPDLTRSVSNLDNGSPATLLDSPTDCLASVMAKDCSQQDVNAALWTPRRSLTEKAKSVHSLFKSPLAGGRALPPDSLANARWDSSRSLNDGAPKSPRKAPQAQASSTVLSQPASVAAEKARPPKTLPRMSLANARWDSSRSLSDFTPHFQGGEESLLDGVQLATRSPRKVPQAQASSTVLSQLASVAAEKALPPAPLTDARCESPGSLNECPPKAPADEDEDHSIAEDDSIVEVDSIADDDSIAEDDSIASSIDSDSDTSPEVASLSQRSEHQILAETLIGKLTEVSSALSLKTSQAKRSPRKFLPEKAKSVHCLFKTPATGVPQPKPPSRTPSRPNSAPPSRGVSRSTSAATSTADLNQMVSTLHVDNSSPAAVLDSSTQGRLPSLMPTDCPPQVVTAAATRSPRKCLPEKAKSVHCLFKTPALGVSQPKAPSRPNSRPPSRGVSRSTSAADLIQMVSSQTAEPKPPSRPPSRGVSRQASRADLNQMASSQTPAPGVSQPNPPSRGISRQASRADLNQMASSQTPAPGVSQPNPPSRGISRQASRADLNHMVSSVPPKTLPPVSLANARWDSSRSLNDSPPNLPVDQDQDESIDSSPEVVLVHPRSPEVGLSTPRSSRKTLSEKGPGMSASKAPPRSLPRATSVVNRKAPPSTLAETRWDSSRSLTDAAPKTPKSTHKKKQKDRHLQALVTKKSSVPPESPVTSTPSFEPHKSIMASPCAAFKSPTSIATPPSAQSRRSRKGESSATGKTKNRPCQRRQLSLLKSAAATSRKNNNNEHTLKDVLDEYAKIIEDFKNSTPV
jgi:hypothetical protein